MSDNTINDGGPAFPNLGYNKEVNYNGMTLRDYFAGQALANHYTLDIDGIPCNVADFAYQVADAMIAARGY